MYRLFHLSKREGDFSIELYCDILGFYHQFRDKKMTEAQKIIALLESTKLYYHVSQCRFRKFRPFSHFGTKQAAKDRLRALDSSKENYYFYVVQFDVTGAPVIEDIEGDLEPLEWAHVLDRRNILDIDLRSFRELSKKEAWAFLQKELLYNDIKVLSYINTEEDVGSTSYVVIDTSIIKVLRRIDNPLVQTAYAAGFDPYARKQGVKKFV